MLVTKRYGRKMHLYTYDKAPNPQRVSHLLNYKNIELDTTQFDLMTGEHFNDAFKKINPDCTVPTLIIDDGVVLTDTIAICVYLDRLYPEKTLFGANDSEYAQVIGWCHKLFLDGFIPIAEVLRNHSPAFKDRALPGRILIAQIPELIERGTSRLEAFWHNMNEHLADREFVVGDQLTMADIDLFVVCGFAGWIKASVPEECTALLQWYAKAKAILEG